jgi:hypothetical protein
MNNENDPIPTLPPESWGFVHPGGEVHIVSTGDVVSCPGQDDDTDSQCTDLTVPSLLDSDVLKHLGPYNDILVGTIFCGTI